MADLNVLAQKVRDTRQKLDAVRLSIRNRTDGLARDRETEAACLAELDVYEQEYRSVFADIRGASDPDNVPAGAPEPGDVPPEPRNLVGALVQF